MKSPVDVMLIPHRGFKTERRSKGDPGAYTEKEHAPTFTSRLRLSNVGGSKTKEADVSRTLLDAEKNPRLKSLLHVENLSTDEQHRLKIAFAEGYLAAEPGKTQSRSYRILKAVQNVLAIIVFLAILFSVMGEWCQTLVWHYLPLSQINNISQLLNDLHRPPVGTMSGGILRYQVDEAKQELKDVVEFLRNPEKFATLGGKLPKGVLLVGPPGTGKTLLARAVAGEAGVPFFHAAGPEFDEILVGQGARRVRDLFRAAKARSPCVVFIDEIDSVGAKRTNSILHPYANQTINQLLSEMDGFHQNEGVIVLGATNRREDLDRALLRPGRFDVEVQVQVPDFTGRKDILEYYLGKVKYGPDVDIDKLARGTTGFTGADIENLVNQAALHAAMEAAVHVMQKHLEFARDKVLMGPERRSRIPDEEANLVTAYHEGGHALVAFFTKDAQRIHKVTIIPRGPSLGHTSYIPEKERYHVTQSQLVAMMDTLMGGRAAEELIFGYDKITSGASSDLKQATAIASHMVKELGMSEKAGLRTYDEPKNAIIVTSEMSSSSAEVVDSEIKRILQESYDRAKAILKQHSKEHKLLAEALLKYETLDIEDVKVIMQGRMPVLLNFLIINAIHSNTSPQLLKFLINRKVSRAEEESHQQSPRDPDDVEMKSASEKADSSDDGGSEKGKESDSGEESSGEEGSKKGSDTEVKSVSEKGTSSGDERDSPRPADSSSEEEKGSDQEKSPKKTQSGSEDEDERSPKGTPDKSPKARHDDRKWQVMDKKDSSDEEFTQKIKMSYISSEDEKSEQEAKDEEPSKKEETGSDKDDKEKDGEMEEALFGDAKDISSEEEKEEDAKGEAQGEEAEQEEEEETTEARINVEIPKISTDLGRELFFVRLPNFLSVEPRTYDHETYEDEIDDEETLDEEGRARLKLKVENTIRWRLEFDKEGNAIKESNARLVRWSDGSLSLHLGSEIFDVYKQPLQGDHNHLYVRQGTGLQGQAVFKEKLSMRPHSTESFTHRKMTRSLADRSAKTQRVKVLSQVGSNPEANREDLIKKAECQSTLQRKTKVTLRKAKGLYVNIECGKARALRRKKAERLKNRNRPPIKVVLEVAVDLDQGVEALVGVAVTVTVTVTETGISQLHANLFTQLSNITLATVNLDVRIRAVTMIR
ncbi:unnamed protein product [Darwinula stevensoni]|uniref:AAA+ ATPase domain-containing protein n=1 Tax=Darwinula stevensoni TaxID=69355 RepID=A0A7R8X6V6_9CRUS|nr:unnamed protein product [Darwinula stevensoni]CAG0881664.1 unnamed protein product [Darwinula stevensoni]